MCLVILIIIKRKSFSTCFFLLDRGNQLLLYLKKNMKITGNRLFVYVCLFALFVLFVCLFVFYVSSAQIRLKPKPGNNCFVISI